MGARKTLPRSGAVQNAEADAQTRTEDPFHSLYCRLGDPTHVGADRITAIFRGGRRFERPSCIHLRAPACKCGPRGWRRLNADHGYRVERAEVPILRPHLRIVRERGCRYPSVVDARLASLLELAGGQARVGGDNALIGRKSRGLLPHAGERREADRARFGVASHEYAELELRECHHGDRYLVRELLCQLASLFTRDEY